MDIVKLTIGKLVDAYHGGFEAQVLSDLENATIWNARDPDRVAHFAADRTIVDAPAEIRRNPLLLAAYNYGVIRARRIDFETYLSAPDTRH